MYHRFFVIAILFIAFPSLTFSQKIIWESGVTGEYGITSPTGNIVATVGSRIISIWDWKEQKCIRNIRVHSNRVMQLSFTPDGEVLASVSRDTTIAFHSMSKDSYEKIIVPSESWLESGSFTPSGKHYVVTNRDLDLFVYETSTKKLLYVKRKFFQNDGQPITFSSDGETVLTSSDFSTVEKINLRTDKSEIVPTIATQEMITSILYSRDNSMFAVTTSDGKAMMYSSVGNAKGTPIGLPNDTIVAFRWGASTKQYSWATTNGFVVVAENGSRKFVPYVEDFTLENFMVDNDQKTVSTVEADGTVRVFTTNNAQLQSTIKHLVQGSYSIAFLDNDRILSVQLDGTIHLHSASDGRSLKTLKHSDGGWLSLTKDKKQFAQFGSSELSIYETKNLKPISSLTLATDNVTGAVWVENNSKIYTSCSDGFIRILSVSPLQCIDSFRVSDKAISSCSLSENEQLLTVVCDDLTTKLLDIKSQSILDSYSKNNGRQVSAFFTDNDKYILSSSVTGFVWKWEIANSEATNVFPEPNVSLIAMILSPSKETLLTTTISGNIRCWDMKTFQVYHSIENNSFATSLEFSPNGKQLVTAYADGTIRLWNVEGIIK
jgi:WD40 repeat protein